MIYIIENNIPHQECNSSCHSAHSCVDKHNLCKGVLCDVSIIIHYAKWTYNFILYVNNDKVWKGDLVFWRDRFVNDSFRGGLYSWIFELLYQVIEMPEHNPGQMGGTMRLGKRKTVFKVKDSVLSE